MPAVQSGWSIIKIKAEAKFCLHIFETALQLQEKNIFGLCSCSYAVAKISKEIIWWYWCHSFLVSHFQIIQVFNMKKYRWMKIWTFSDETNMTFFLVAHHWQKGFSVIKSRKKKKRRKTWFLLTTIKWSLKMHVFFFLWQLFLVACCQCLYKIFSSRLLCAISQVHVPTVLLQMKVIW